MPAPVLALLGGQPESPQPLAAPPWPPVSDKTADRLRELYLSRQWSFNCPAEQAFARAFAASHDAKHGIYMCNGTTTLECALAAAGIGPGDEVIVPAVTWMATAMAVHYVGATPVFVDIEPDTLCLDPAKAAAALTARTRAMIPVHLYGSMADLDALTALARQHNLFLLEDCAHMHGGKWNGRGAGSWGQVGSFSFQQSKTMAGGEGGICLTNDDELAERIFRLKHIGYAEGARQGDASAGPPPGLVCHNYRGTGFEALILHDQLEGLPERIARYNANRAIIASYLRQVKGVRLQAPGRLADPQGCYALCIVCDQGALAEVPRQRIVEAAAAEGLRLGATFGPVYRHILYNMPEASYRIADGGCPVAERQGGDRAFQMLHTWLGADEATIHTIGRILAKLAANGQALARADARYAGAS